MRFIGIIPARYNSSRLPGKPLAMIGDKPMIQWVYEHACEAIDTVVVATDDERIARVVNDFGGKAVITSAEHDNGTSRVYEAYKLLGDDYDVVVNIQGDEPFVDPGNIEALCRSFDMDDDKGDHQVDISTLVSRFDPARGFDALADENLVKVVIDNAGYAMLFSRAVIPTVRGEDNSQWLKRHDYYVHLGAYAYRADILRRIVEMPEMPLQMAESLEQLAWMQCGIKIYTVAVEGEVHGIDTPADLEAARLFVRDSHLTS